MPPTQNVERLLSLALTLAATRRGLSRSELLHLVPGYGEGGAATKRRQFVRDLARLDKLGLDIRTEPDPLDPQTPRYRLVTSDGAGRTFEAGPEERAVLAAAAAMWSTERGSGLGARVRAKLASEGITTNGRGSLGRLGASAALSPLLEAYAGTRAVTFTYRTAPGREAEQRHVEPWKVGTHEGREYVYGFDLVREAPRLFRVSRIESTPLDAGAATHPREAVNSFADLVGPEAAGTDAHAAIAARVEPYKALALRAQCGVGAHEDAFEIPPAAHARALTLALAEPMWVALEGDALVVDEWRRIRERVREAHTGEADVSEADVARLPLARPAKPRDVGRGDDDLARLSAEIAYVYAHGEVGFEEMAAHFGISTDDLDRDLRTLYMAGDYSSGIDELVDAQWEGGVVSIRGADALAVPLTLTPSEASALLLGIEALGPVDDLFSPSALLNVRTLLTGILGEQRLRSAAEDGTGHEEPARQEPTEARIPRLIEDALQGGTRVRIMYSPPDRPGVSVRDVSPRGMLSMYGTVYVEATCHLAGDVREFRMDRIVAAWAPGDESAPACGDGTSPSILQGLDTSSVLLEVQAGAHWLLEAFSSAGTRYDSRTGLTYARVSSRSPHALVAAIFETGSRARVIAPAPLRSAVHRVAETFILTDQE